MCWHSRCCPVAKPLRNGHVPLTSSAPATVLVPALQFVTAEVIQSENNFLEQSCCQEQDVKQPQSWQSHSTARQAQLTIHCISFFVLTGHFWFMLLPSLLLSLSHFTLHTSVMYRETEETEPCWAHLCLTTATAQAAVLMIWATFSACCHWEKHAGYDALETYWTVLTKSPVAAVSITIPVCSQIHTADIQSSHDIITCNCQRCCKGLFKPILLWTGVPAKVHANFTEVISDFSSQLHVEDKIYKRHHACQIMGSWLELKESAQKQMGNTNAKLWFLLE